MSNAEHTISTRQVIADIENWDAITDRRTETPGDAATDNWISEQIEAAGLNLMQDVYGVKGASASGLM